MKINKHLFAIGAVSIAAVGLIIGSATVGSKKADLFSGYADTARTLTLTSADFAGASGDFTKGGISFHYEGASKSSDVVSIAAGRIYMTMAHYSGDSKNGEGLRGDGFTRLVFTDFGKTLNDGDGTVIYTKSGTADDAKASVALTEDVDLTKSGAVSSANRRRIHIEGADDTFSFTSATFYYECTISTPSVEIEGTISTCGVGEELSLTAVPYELFGDEASFAWTSSNTDVATVTTGSTDVTVTGVAAGNAVITCTMTTGGNNYVDTFDVTISAAASNVVSIDVLSTTYWQGTGLFFEMNPSSAGITYDELNALAGTVAISTTSTAIGNATPVNFQTYTTNTRARFYMTFGNVPANEIYTITVEFTNASTSPVTKYRAIGYFNETTYVGPVFVDGTTNVDIGSDITDVTATLIAEGTADSYSWVSSDNSIATVSGTTNQPTIHGVAEGSATITVTITLDDGVTEYSGSIDINVVDPSSDVPAVTWYTEGIGNQRNHVDGAGIWTWVDITGLGYAEYADFNNATVKSKIVLTHSMTTVTLNVISDYFEAAGHKIVRMYLVMGAAQNSGVLSVKIPTQAGILAEGNITFVNGEATAYNS